MLKFVTDEAYVTITLLCTMESSPMSLDPQAAEFSRQA